MDNTAQFIKEIEKFKEEIEQEGVDLVKKTAELAFDMLVMYSPVFTGSYVMSHRIGLNGPSNAPPTIHAGLKLGAGAKRLAMSRKAELQRIDKKVTSVHITNDLYYAVNVEYGWATGHPGYFPFTNTMNAMRVALGAF